MRSWLALALVALTTLLPAAARAQVRVSMTASASRVAVGEPFAVEIRIETKGEDPDEVELPDFGELEVLGRSTARPMSFSFGFGSGGQHARVKSEIIYTFTLRAPEAGVHTIRPVIVKTEGRRIASQSLSIMVLEPSQALGGGPGATPGAGAVQSDDDGTPAPPTGPLDGARYDPTMFVRTVVDKKRAYVGEQVTVTIYLYLRGQLGDSPSITREPTLEGFWSQDLLPMQRSLSAVRQEVNGRSYNAYVLRRFAAFPLRAGTLDIGAPAVEVGGGGSIFDLLTGPSRPMQREGVKVSIEALPLPAQPTAGAPTYTGTLTLDAALDASSAKIGDAVTLRLTAKGHGNLRGLTLAGPRLDGVELLAPEIDDQVTHDLDQLGGQRTFRWLLLPRTPGTLKIPSFVVDVFDPESGRFSTVRSQPLTLTVSGTAQPAPRAEPSRDAAPSGTGTDLLAPRFGPVRTESALRRQEPALSERGFFWPLVLAAPLLLLGVWGGQRVQRLVAARRSAHPESEAAREASARIDEAARASGDPRRALSLLSSALKRALEAKLGEPVGGMTLSALEKHLVARGLDPKLVARAVAQLGALDQARFDPNAQGAVEISRAVDGVRAFVADLARAKSLKMGPAGARAGGSEPGPHGGLGSRGKGAS